MSLNTKATPFYFCFSSVPGMKINVEDGGGGGEKVPKETKHCFERVCPPRYAMV